MLHLDLKEGSDLYLLDEKNQLVGRIVFISHLSNGVKLGFETTDKITVLRSKLWKMMQPTTIEKRKIKLGFFKKED